MAGVDISGSRKPPSIRSQDSGRGLPMNNGYGPVPGGMSGRGPPLRGYPQQGVPPGSGPRGPPPGDYHHDYQDDSCGPVPMPVPGPRGLSSRGHPPPRARGPDGLGGPGGFGPLERSMTMPVNNNMGPPDNRMPQSRMELSPGFEDAPRHPVPPRPSTATGNRPPPQRSYTGQTVRSSGSTSHYDSGYGPLGDQWQQGPRADNRTTLGEFYDSYYYQGRSSNASDFQRSIRDSTASEMPDFDAMPEQRDSRARDSLDQHLMAASEQQLTGPSRVTEVSRTKSHPNLRQPQQAVIEMAGDVPPMPNQYQYQNFNDPYQDSHGYQQPPDAGFGDGLGSMRVSGQSPAQRGSGGAHPTPIRPGLMPDSMVNQMNNRPPPARTYTSPQGPSQTPIAGPPQPSQSAPPTNGPPPPEAEPPITSEELELLRTRVKTNPADQETALHLAKKLVEASEALIPNVADPKTRQRARDRYVMDAHKILKKLANAQNPGAMFFLADCLGKGALLHDPDSKEAFALYQSAAKLGHPQAAYRTAVCCEIGSDEGGGTRKDPLKAIQWYKRAAMLGDTPAMYKMGMILLKGLLGHQKNQREAVVWLKRAAERADKENPHSLHELGLLFESASPNDVIVRDEQYALSLFQQAADLGYKFSQFRLGATYEFGLMGCPIDSRQSILWYSRAAMQEEHQAELALSGWYLTGSEGVLGQSDTEAYLWARKAAMAGLAKAEYAMGYYTEVGIGVPSNLEDAKRWYWRAAAQDFPKARERLEDIKRAGKNSGPRQRERITRSKIGRQQENECVVM